LARASRVRGQPNVPRDWLFHATRQKSPAIHEGSGVRDRPQADAVESGVTPLGATASRNSRGVPWSSPGAFLGELCFDGIKKVSSSAGLAGVGSDIGLGFVSAGRSRLGDTASVRRWPGV